MPSRRLIEFDIMRGLLIILVAIGHSGVKMPWAPWVEPHWFRMPAFFMLSGYFMRELCCDAHTLRRRAVRLVLPWIAYSVLMWCLFHPEPLLKNVARTVYAGSYNVTFYSFPWWFVNALMVSLIAFALLKRLNRGG